MAGPLMGMGCAHSWFDKGWAAMRGATAHLQFDYFVVMLL